MITKIDAHLLEGPSATQDLLSQRFLGAAEDMAYFGKSLGIAIVPYLDPTLPLLQDLKLEDQLKTVEKLENTRNIYATFFKESKDVKSSASLVWMACNGCGLRPTSDFFDKLSDDDVVQVYSIEGIHQFSNLNLFKICSYTLEQVYCTPWTSLWHRDDQDLQVLQDAVVKIMSPEQRTSFQPQGRAHRVVETSSVFKYETEYSLKCISPLFSRETREKRGFVVCERVELRSVYAPKEEEVLLQQYDQKRPLSSVLRLADFSRS